MSVSSRPLKSNYIHLRDIAQAVLNYKKKYGLPAEDYDEIQYESAVLLNYLANKYGLPKSDLARLSREELEAIVNLLDRIPNLGGIVNDSSYTNLINALDHAAVMITNRQNAPRQVVPLTPAQRLDAAAHEIATIVNNLGAFQRNLSQFASPAYVKNVTDAMDRLFSVSVELERLRADLEP